MKARVYYSPTRTNCTFVSKMQGLPEFRKFDFVSLSSDLASRELQLTQIRLPAIYLWGNGDFHRESYFLTHRERMPESKFNIDQHSDGACLRRHVRTLTMRSSVWPSHLVGCGNHMRASHDQGIRVFSAHTFYDGKSPFCADTIRNMLLRLSSRAEIFGKRQVSITVDGDAIANFAARPKWVFKEGIPVHEISPFILSFRGKLLSGDFGGAVEGIEHFDLLPRTNLVPAFEETCAFSGYYEGSLQFGQPPKNILDKVASYTFYSYVDVILAFSCAMNMRV